MTIIYHIFHHHKAILVTDELAVQLLNVAQHWMNVHNYRRQQRSVAVNRSSRAASFTTFFLLVLTTTVPFYFLFSYASTITGPQALSNLVNSGYFAKTGTNLPTFQTSCEIEYEFSMSFWRLLVGPLSAVKSETMMFKYFQTYPADTWILSFLTAFTALFKNMCFKTNFLLCRTFITK